VSSFSTAVICYSITVTGTVYERSESFSLLLLYQQKVIQRAAGGCRRTEAGTEPIFSLCLIAVPAESDTTGGGRVSWNGSRHPTNLLLSFIAVPVESDTVSSGCRGTEIGTKVFSLSFINVSWNGSIYLREKWNASVPQQPLHLHLCILDSTTTRTHSIDVATHSCHQLTILYRKHYDRLSLCVIFIMVSYFFHWAGKQIFVPFLFLFLSSRVR
jgi:hypothetical protein